MTFQRIMGVDGRDTDELQYLSITELIAENTMAENLLEDEDISPVMERCILQYIMDISCEMETRG